MSARGLAFRAGLYVTVFAAALSVPLVAGAGRAEAAPGLTCGSIGAVLVSGSTCEVTFTAVGSASWTVPAGVTSVDVLVVAGGGGGAAGVDAWNPLSGGGGGGGEVVVATGQSVSGSIAIDVGAGGASGQDAIPGSPGEAGTGSSFGALVTASGGQGGQGTAGGYLGGTSGRGRVGGAPFRGAASFTAGGGGGGDGAVGQDAVYRLGGDGGQGTVPSGGLFDSYGVCLGGGGAGGGGDLDTSTWLPIVGLGKCGGGNGSEWSDYSKNASAGSANSGGGGGGGTARNGSYFSAGNGGSGLVVVRFTLPAAIALVKSSTTESFSAVGDRVAYSFVVTNTGGVPLTSVSVVDVQTAPAVDANLSAVSCPSATLAVGASETCTATYTVTQADLDHGSVLDTATASGISPSDIKVTSDAASVTVAATQTPAITVVKSSNTSSYSAVGDHVAYSFTVTNTGNVALSGVTVADDQTAPALAGNLSPVTCPATSLPAKASLTCTATYTVTQADLDNGSLRDTATATGTPPSGAAVTSDPSSLAITAHQAKNVAISINSGSPQPDGPNPAGLAVATVLLLGGVVAGAGSLRRRRG